MRAEVIHVKKIRPGPGGWHCPCCNPMGCSPRKMKARARRIVRHVNKQRLAKDISDE